MKKSYVNLGNARTRMQAKVMSDIDQQNICPFCTEHLRRFHKKPMLKETQHWVLTKNQWPYENTRIHLLAIAKKHTEKLSDLPRGAGEDLLKLMAWAEKTFSILGGGIGFRFGDPKKNGGTVRHLHVHFLSAKVHDQKKKTYRPVRIRVG